MSNFIGLQTMSQGRVFVNLDNVTFLTANERVVHLIGDRVLELSFDSWHKLLLAIGYKEEKE